MRSTTTSADGHIAIVSMDFSPKKKLVQRLNLYAPGAATATATFVSAGFGGEDVRFCNDTILQVTARDKKPTRLILRDLSGNLLTQIDGPSSKNYASVSCNGRHVVVASLTKDGPVLSEYDL